MEKRMQKGKAKILICIGLVGILSGCGNTIPEMTPEQQEMVAEYTVGTVLKYDRNYKKRLLTAAELDAIDKQDSEPDMERGFTEPLPIQEQDNGQGEGTWQPEPSGEMEGQEAAAPMEIGSTEAVSIEDFLQTESLAFHYQGFETVDRYPEINEEEELFFAMSATPGQKLLIARFQVANEGTTDEVLDMNQLGTRFKIAVDGEEKNALTTMLLNDLSYYSGTIAAGESQELVLVCEVPEEKASTISNLELIIKNVENTATISLN